MQPRPPIHIMIYGPPHFGKSYFARTLPTPMLIFMFDYYGKDLPYLQGGTVVDQGVDVNGTPVKHVMNGEQLLFRIEYYHEPYPDQPSAYKRFLQRMVRLHEEFSQWQTYVVDSVTTQQMVALAHEKIINPDDRMTMVRYANVTASLEETLMMRFGGIPANVCVIAHEVEKEETKSSVNAKGQAMQIGTGKYIRGINAFGRLHNVLPAGFGEFYRMRREQNNFWLQTEPEGMWQAGTSIGAPNRCAPDYQSLWVNWEGGK